MLDPTDAETGRVGSFAAVVTTGIYCVSTCAARPGAENVRPFACAVGAEAAGYRACHRCRPYRGDVRTAEGAPEIVCDAIDLIADGCWTTPTGRR